MFFDNPFVFLREVVFTKKTNKNIQLDSTKAFEYRTTLWEKLKYDGTSVFGGIKHTYSRPFQWKGNDWAKFGGVVGGTALIYLIDEPGNDYFTDQAEDIPHFIKEVGFRFGKPAINYGLTTGVYAFGLLTKNEKIKKQESY